MSLNKIRAVGKAIWFPSLIVLLISAAAVLLFVQQRTVDELDGRIEQLNQQIANSYGKGERKEKLTLEKDLVALQKDRINAQNAIYGNVAQTVGGVSFLITAFLTLRKNRSDDEKQRIDRFSTAIEHLKRNGNNELHIRLGGIYSLQQIAEDDPRNCSQVVEILSIFVWQNFSENQQEAIEKNLGFKIERFDAPEIFFESEECPPDDIDPDKYHFHEYYEEYLGSEEAHRKIIQDYKHPIRTDIQAALFAISRLTNSYRKSQRIILNLSKTDLRGTTISGRLSGTNFERSDLQWVVFQNIDLRNANLSYTKLEAAGFINANLENTQFKNAHLRWARFIKRINLEGANFEGANLSDTTLNRCNLSNSNLRRTLCLDSEFRGACLYKADLYEIRTLGSDFSSANLQHANLEHADLSSSILRKADLRWAKLMRAKLSGADLENADLRDANLKGAIFGKVNLTNAKIDGADLQEAIDLDPEIVVKAIGWDKDVKYGERFRKKLDEWLKRNPRI